MHLDHVSPGWTPLEGCAADCVGTFLHPNNACSRALLIVGHSCARFELIEEVP
jgi:hypothetical protein